MKTLYLVIILSILSGCSTTQQNTADNDYETLKQIILQDRRNDAIAFATQKISLYPNDSRFYYIRGYCLLKTNREAARNDFVSCIKLDKTDGRGYYGMGSYYHAIEQYDLAIKNLKLALSLSKETEKTPNIYVALAVVYTDQKKYVKAIVTIKKALQYKDDGSLYYRLGIAYIHLNQYDKSEKYWLTAINDKHFNQILFKHQTFYRLANLYHYQQKYDQAKLYIDKAIDLDPGNSLYLKELQAINRKLKGQS